MSDGGAFQVSLAQLQVDCYPYHLATGDRSSWIRYNSESSVHTGWLENGLKQFQTDLLESVATLKESAANSTVTQPPQVQHAPLSRATGNNKSSLPNVKNNGGNGNESSDMADILVTQFRKCLTTNLVVRLNNFTLWKVSTSKVKTAPKEFLAGK